MPWTASSDYVEPASAIEYEIVVNGIIHRPIVDATIITAHHTNLDGSNTLAVRALDRSGNIAPASNPVTSVFQECRPSGHAAASRGANRCGAANPPGPSRARAPWWMPARLCCSAYGELP